MATARLDERQKQEMAERYRAGDSSASLAQTYGCSPNTVTRTVRAVLGDAAFEQLKQQRGRPTPQLELLAASPEAEPDSLAMDSLAMDGADDRNDDHNHNHEDDDDQDDDQDDDDDDDDDDDVEDDDDLEADLQADLEDGGPEVVLPLLPQPLSAGERTVSRPLPMAQLPGSLYLLVDKEVELRGTRLTDLSELSPLAPEEEPHQAMVMFANPRNAKRQAGRSQRVIKVPDPSLLERTAPYIRAQGITRVVLEGVLYALPGG